ncbi:MAG TPA: sulfite exporter TauE/SafE family protein [Terriglobia bacterium]|nr:sulfite exporter TauE/SafE family protein [Terriglobia bacterium]
MSALPYLALVATGAFAAGIVGALTGEGGGVLLVPTLVLIFGVNMHNAAGASIIAVMMTSTAATIAFLSQGYTNLRIAMFLQLTCIAGGIAGALLVASVPAGSLKVIFGLVLLFSSFMAFRRKEEGEPERPSDPLAVRLHMESSYPVLGGWRPYKVFRVIPGALLMSIAGIISGLLGIGAGAVNVLVMDQAMRLPYKVSASTSNFMIGITAAGSAGIYLHRGYIDPVLTMPVVLGIFLGAAVGARLMMAVRVRPLRIFFSVLVFVAALEMIYKGLIGGGH